MGVPMAGPLILPAQLSAAMVAFTIEADNEAERRLAHTTTSFGAAGPRGSVWLTSLAMWFNCLRGLSDGGPQTVAELERRARMGTNLDGMRRWGYVTIDSVGRVRRGDPRPRAKAGSVLELTERGRVAAGVWRSVPDEIDGHWQQRFGAAALDRVRDALRELLRRDDVVLPDFMPIGSAWGVGVDDPAPGDTPGADVAGLALISLLSRALLWFALDYERDAKLSLATQLNGVRVLDRDGVPLRDLPGLTGVSKEAVAMLVKQLERVGCVEVRPIPGSSRGKQVRLTGDHGVRPRRLGPGGCSRRSSGGASDMATSWSPSWARRLSRSSATARARARPCSPGSSRIRTGGVPRCPRPSCCRGFRWCCIAAATPTAAELA